jgi:F0F1-type ATP synthase assembly protein I
MIRGQVLKAAFFGAIIVLFIVTLLGVVLGFLLMPAAMADVVWFILILAISGFIAGFITVYFIMNMAIKKLVATFMPAPAPEKKKK